MSDIIIFKRDGSEQFLDTSKLAESIFGAAVNVGGEDMDLAEDLAYKVLDILESNDINEITSDALQKLVEDTLIDEGHSATARQYILKGADRRRIRELDTSLIKSFEELTFQSEEESDTKRENANIDSSTSMGTMLKYGSESAKSFNLSYLLSRDISEAHKNGDIHIHDLDFLSLTATCDQIPLDTLFKNGFNTGHGFLREPGNIRTAAALTAIALQSNQNDQHGGQSIPMLDHYLSPYVALSYVVNIARECKSKLDLSQSDRKELKARLKNIWSEHKHLMNEPCKRLIVRELKAFLSEKNVEYTEKNIDSILRNAYDDTYDDTFQSMEGLVHNLNTMHCLPASEKIWVYDYEVGELKSITMEKLHNTFKNKRYKVISLNKDTGKAEFKYITHCKKMDNNREIVALTDKQGRTVRVTDNHRIMTIKGMTISETIPKDCLYTISPRGIDIKTDIIKLDTSAYGTPRKDNPFQSKYVDITPKFAEFIGYYMADGCMLGETSTCCISACGKVSFEYIEQLLKEVFNCEFKTSYTYFNHSTNGKQEKDIRIQLGMPLARMLKDKFGRIGKEKKIPTEFMLADENIKKAFLKAYFSLDGRKDKKYSEVSTVNKELQAQVALMISSLGASSHYTTRECSDGFNNNREMPMHFITLGAYDSVKVGLKEQMDTKFEIPKYNLGMIYDNYKNICDKICKNRSSRNVRYTELEELLNTHNIPEAKKFLNFFVNEIDSKKTYNSGEEYVYDISVEDNENFLTYECIYVHNSRAGAQVPFSSVNYGTDTTVEGRMIQETLLKTTWDGLGNGETPIFPIQILKLKKGINVDPKDPCYDIFELACKVSARRLYPNFCNLDAPYNAELYVEGHPETEMATMGCAEGNEYVDIRVLGVKHKVKFKNAWSIIVNYVGEDKIKRSGCSEYLDLSNTNIGVYDSYSGKYAKALKIIRNHNVNNWRTVILVNGQVMVLTGDHPLHVIRNGEEKRIYVDNLCLSDKLVLADSKEQVEITEIKSGLGYSTNRSSGYSYDFETETDRLDISGIMSHNCRTRVGKNVYDPTKSVIPGRGNLSFTSINLPRIGIKAEGDINKFYRLLDLQLSIVHRELLERLKIISKRKPLNYPFLMGQGCWIGSENLGPTDSLEEVWKHGTLGVGFIGLAETLVALTGKHHGESEESQKLGLEIVGYMRKAVDKWAQEEKLNYSLIGTPAEGLSGRFIRMDKKLFGIIPGITDRDYYTNSSHVPVYYPISAKKKIDIEAPYHEIENGGHILYIEMDGDPTKNIKAFEKVVKYMHDKNAGYMAVNHPVDRDPVCNYVGIIGDTCPRCGRKDGEPMTLEMWHKIKGFANAGNAETLGYHGNILEENDRMTNDVDDL